MHEAESPDPLVVAVMMAFPGDIPVTRPDSSTVATDSSEDCQVNTFS